MNSYPLLKALCRVLTIGVRKHVTYELPLPPSPLIFACAHPTNIDLAYVVHLMDDPIALVMQWGLDVPIVGSLMRDCGFIPVGRDGRSAFSAALNALLKGKNVYICPEGKLSGPDSVPKTGAARLSEKTNVPIAPVGIRHEGRVCSIPVGNGRFVKYMPFGHTYITFGAPFYGRGMHLDPQFVTRRLMQIIKALSE